MTTNELVSRYQSDTRAWHEALENEIVTWEEHERQIERLDNDFFNIVSLSETFDAEKVLTYATL